MIERYKLLKFKAYNYQCHRHVELDYDFFNTEAYRMFDYIADNFGEHGKWVIRDLYVANPVYVKEASCFVRYEGYTYNRIAFGNERVYLKILLGGYSGEPSHRYYEFVHVTQYGYVFTRFAKYDMRFDVVEPL